MCPAKMFRSGADELININGYLVSSAVEDNFFFYIPVSLMEQVHSN